LKFKNIDNLGGSFELTSDFNIGEEWAICKKGTCFAIQFKKDKKILISGPDDDMNPTSVTLDIIGFDATPYVQKNEFRFDFLTDDWSVTFVFNVKMGWYPGIEYTPAPEPDSL
jgi:hypothetical protein